MTAPTLFTHFYFAGSGAVDNPAADYIKSAIVVRGKDFSETCEGPDGERYVFSFWLSVKHDQLVAVRPSDAVIDGWREKHGGRLTAFMPQLMHGNETARMKACMREPSSSSGFSWDAIAGNVDAADMYRHMLSLLGDEYAEDLKITFAQK